jgi:hypothetical protein
MTPPLPLLALVEVECSNCLGEGGWDDEQGPLMCFTCCGTGKVEICECGQAPATDTDECGCAQHPEVLWAIQAGMTTAEQIGM